MIRNRSRLLAAVLSFILPVILLNLIFLTKDIYPFGKYSLLQADLKYQYISLLSYFRTSILSGHFSNFIYSFSASVGSNMTGLVAYYYLNPLFIILLFFKTGNLPVAIYFITNLIIGLAGLSMFYYCLHSKLVKINLFFMPVFSTAFALMSYNLANLSNMMWLTDVILLPLAALGIEKLIAENRGKLYFFSLTFSILFNYYIGYMLCVFSVLYFIYVWLLRNHITMKNFKASASVFRKYIVLSAFSFLVNLIALLPAVISTAAAKSSSSHQIYSLQWLIDPFLVIRSLFIIKNTQLAVPNIYCGLFISLLAVLYFSNQKITRRDKIISLLLILSLFASLEVQVLNVTWQMFHSPQGFPQRFSFIVAFVLILLAMKSMQHFNQGISRTALIKVYSGILLAIFVTLVSLHYASYGINKIQILSSLLLLTVYSALLWFIARRQVRFGQLGKFLLLAFFSCELILTQSVSFIENGPHDSYDSFKKYVTQNQTLIDRIQKKDPGFYRMEKNYERYAPALDDSLLFNYYGISHYSSSLSVQTRNALGQLGFTSFHSVWPSWVNYNQGSTLATDTLLGVKYVLSNQSGIHKGNLNMYQRAYVYQDYSVFKNPYFIGLGIPSSSNLNGLPRTGNPFTYQNAIWTRMTGTDRKIFQPVNYQIRYHNVRSIHGSLSRVDRLKNGYIELTFHKTNDPLYFELSHYGNSIKQSKNYRLYLGKKLITAYPTYLNNGIIPLAIKDGKGNIKLHLQIPAKKSIAKPKIRLYAQNMKTFGSMVSKLKQNEFKLSKMTNTQLAGTITANSPHKYLFISVPYDKNWHVSVNNHSVPVSRVAGNFMLIPLVQGTNRVVIRYTDSYLLWGAFLSTLSILTLIFGGVLWRKIKYDRSLS